MERERSTVRARCTLEKFFPRQGVHESDRRRMREVQYLGEVRHRTSGRMCDHIEGDVVIADESAHFVNGVHNAECHGAEEVCETCIIHIVRIYADCIQCNQVMLTVGTVRGELARPRRHSVGRPALVRISAGSGLTGIGWIADTRARPVLPTGYRPAADAGPPAGRRRI